MTRGPDSPAQPSAAPLRIALIASARHPITEPFAGGLEAHTWTLSTALRARGHEVTVFAGPGSDPALGVIEMPLRPARISESACRDTSMVAAPWLEEHHAYLQLMLELTRGPSRYDLVHNNSLNYLPVAMAPALTVPVVTTLHTPPTPWIESAIQVAPTARSTSTRSAPTRLPPGGTSSPPPPSYATASTPGAGSPAPAARTWSGRGGSFRRRAHTWRSRPRSCPADGCGWRDR
ncbi:glycosyltransferase [Streptomyces globisporus]|uniref:glycosyltransferase n=1 Tax=Streptomyces globisporus TaxID=1908 RepID=UPI000ABDFAC1|nr:glycosyltransferase [Streptomyces globisporus]